MSGALAQRELGHQHGQRRPAAVSGVCLPRRGGDSSAPLSLACRAHAEQHSFRNIPHAALPFC